MENKRTRGNFNVMCRLVGLVRPLAPVMVCAVLLGVAGFLCAIFIPVLGVYALLDSLHFSVPVVLKTACILLPILAVARGVLHYAEQGCNHFIAFKLLALIRDKVFGVLRQLAPAKLEGLDGQVFLDETEDAYCVWRAEYSRRRRVCSYFMDIFRLEEESGLWERGEELHEERAYTPEELTSYLRDAGFTQIKQYGNLKHRPPKPGEDRIFFTARKEV